MDRATGEGTGVVLADMDAFWGDADFVAAIPLALSLRKVKLGGTVDVGHRARPHGGMDAEKSRPCLKWVTRVDPIRG